MDKRVNNTFVKVADVSEYFESARIETHHPIEEIEPINRVLTVSELDSEKIDNSLNKMADMDLNLDVIDFEENPRTNISDEAILKLNAKNITVITVSNEEN